MVLPNAGLLQIRSSATLKESDHGRDLPPRVGNSAVPAQDAPPTITTGAVTSDDADEGGMGEGTTSRRRIFNPYRSHKVVNALNSTFTVSMADISNACVDVWIEVYLRELPGCPVALEVHPGTKFKELGGHGRRTRQSSSGLTTM